MMLPSEYLEKGWTRKSNARDRSGRSVSPVDQSARFWCMRGAIDAALYDGEYTNDDYKRLSKELERQIFKLIGVGDIEYYNDSANRTQDEVIAFMKQVEQELELNNVA